MDYLDPDKKRKHTYRLFIGYALMAVVIGLGTIILALMAYGYTFDRSQRTVIQNGLLFVDMGPVNADVYINGDLRGRGNQRLVLPADNYTIEIREEGYRTWQKDIRLAGGTVERFTYPVLFPNELSRSTYRTFKSEPQLITTSPDRRWMLIQESREIDAFVLYDLRQQINLPTFFSLPSGVMSSDAEDSTLELVEWSNDNEHLILRHSFRGGQEYILLNHNEPNTSQNLSTRFSDIPFTNISLIDKEPDAYHLFNSNTGDLIQAELAEEETELILEDVLTYRSHGSDRILYVSSVPLPTEENNDARYGIYLYEDEDSYQITSLPAGESSDYLLDLARFSGSWYVVVGNATEGRSIIYKDPLEALNRNGQRALLPLFTLRTASNPERVAFSANARNIKMQAGHEIAVFDLERERSYRYSLENEDVSPASWMDGHRITAVLGNVLSVTDFDGENRHELIPCRDEHPPLFDPNYEYLYCVAPSSDGDGYGALIRAALTAADQDD